MTADDHYAEAEMLLLESKDRTLAEAAVIVAAAQVHATLSVAAAIAADHRERRL